MPEELGEDGCGRDPVGVIVPQNHHGHLFFQAVPNELGGLGQVLNLAGVHPGWADQFLWGGPGQAGDGLQHRTVVSPLFPFWHSTVLISVSCSD